MQRTCHLCNKALTFEVHESDRFTIFRRVVPSSTKFFYFFFFAPAHENPEEFWMPCERPKRALHQSLLQFQKNISCSTFVAFAQKAKMTLNCDILNFCRLGDFNAKCESIVVRKLGDFNVWFDFWWKLAKLMSWIFVFLVNIAYCVLLQKLHKWSMSWRKSLILPFNRVWPHRQSGKWHFWFLQLVACSPALTERSSGRSKGGLKGVKKEES